MITFDGSKKKGKIQVLCQTNSRWNLWHAKQLYILQRKLHFPIDPKETISNNKCN